MAMTGGFSIKKDRMILIVAGIAGIVAFMGFYGMMKGAKDPDRKVVLAKEDLASGTVLTEEHLEISKPFKGVDPAIFHLSIEDVLGLTLDRDIPKGAALRRAYTQKIAGPVEKKLPIPDGMLALTLSLHEIKKIPEFIAEESYVDVLGYKTANTQEQSIIVRSAQVLALTKDEQGEMIAVTLALTPSEAEVVTSSTRRGSVRLVLRSRALLKDREINLAPGSMMVIRESEQPEVVSFQGSVNDRGEQTAEPEKKRSLPMSLFKKPTG